MRFGVCRGLDDLSMVEQAKKIGFDYYETSFSSLSECSEEAFDAFSHKLFEVGLKCEALNCFLPGGLSVTGENVDHEKVALHLDRGFKRASLIGVRSVVFGSGRQRSCPEGFSPEKAYGQLVSFLRDEASPRAKKYGICIAVEPLSFDETNLIYTVGEGVKLALDSGSDAVFGLADLYHVYRNHDDVDGIASFTGKIRHAHIAEPQKRLYPAESDSAETRGLYRRFLAALSKAGCERCSVEAHCDDFALEAPGALSVLRSLCEPR